MDVETARSLLRASFRSASELQALLPRLRESVDDAEYQVWSRAIAAVLAENGQQITMRVLKEHPELEGEVENAVVKGGRY